MLAAVVGYVVNLLFVGVYGYLQDGTSPMQILREIHVGLFGEFVLSYMGLALFSVLVATTFQEIGILSIFVFIAPLAFARQMFTRTHSLQEATNELAAKQAENEHQALHDSLTGLPNRMLFQQRLADAIEDARERNGRIAVMLMDLDHFKEVNDTLGHHFGDQLLKEIGPRLSTVLRDDDMMARLGGDEFGVAAARSSRGRRGVLDRTSGCSRSCSSPSSVEGLALDVSGSLGIALFPTQSRDAESLLRRADVAMYAAKEAGGGYEVYTPEMDQHNPSRLTLVSQVRPAIERRRVRDVLPAEGATVRRPRRRGRGAHPLEPPRAGLVPPDEFIPLVEKTVLLRRSPPT